jgi:hypothetical protein
MQAALAARIDELVPYGWEPVTTTETSASLSGRRPFSWWLFLFVIVFFPFFGGSDTVECRSMAQQAAGGTGAGQAARGAALGAFAGGATRGSRQTASADANFQQAFSNCLRARGHNVLT